MKRLGALLSTILLAVTLTACGGQSYNLNETVVHDNVSWKVSAGWQKSEYQTDTHYGWVLNSSQDAPFIHVDFPTFNTGKTPDGIIASQKDTVTKSNAATGGPIGKDWTDESLGTRDVSNHTAYIYMTEYTPLLENGTELSPLKTYTALIEYQGNYIDITSNDEGMLNAVLDTVQIA